ncbi:glycerophosphodiester phosphodiesterase [Paenibacillus sp. LMG 31456]|uniref:Glycerophosphodiester phosphodiesterase n=1 Tax=Paenibacillus foliorum TaxID=2654974 RepID=A0A972K2W9_9BACL|nr:glycerophosphodiester phosphodiesterase family protein [Paenibacillus foliorum]NOU94312.1 glycerophosphodiester phosphodiesterase [Paenibacillus foliorum]
MIGRLENNNSIVVAAHRGLKCDYPENTLLAFQKAMESKVDMLELDLRLSKDGVVMVIHDETLERTTNGSGKVMDYTLAELKQLDAGAWFGPVFEGLKIPTLDELCSLIASYPEILLNVEIKPSPNAKWVVDKAVAMLDEFGYLPRCVFTSFDAVIIAYIYDTYQLKTQGFPAELMYNFDSGPDGTYSKMWAVGISMKLLTPELVQDFRDKDILPWCYCPDVDQQVYYALGCGATLMTCNNPRPAQEIRYQIEQNGR